MELSWYRVRRWRKIPLMAIFLGSSIAFVYLLNRAGLYPPWWFPTVSILILLPLLYFRRGRFGRSPPLRLLRHASYARLQGRLPSIGKIASMITEEFDRSLGPGRSPVNWLGSTAFQIQINSAATNVFCYEYGYAKGKLLAVIITPASNQQPANIFGTMDLVDRALAPLSEHALRRRPLFA